MNYYERLKAEELAQRLEEIKIKNIDYSLDETRDIAEFFREFKIFTKTSKEIDISKIEALMRDIHVEIQKMNFHRNDIRNQLIENKVILRTNSEYFENYEGSDFEDYEYEVILPATDKCGELTLKQNFEANLEDRIISCKRHICQLETDILKYQKENEDYKKEKHSLNPFKDGKKIKYIASMVRINKKMIAEKNDSLSKHQQELKELEIRQKRINAIHPEDRMLINQLIDESVMANWTLSNNFNDLQYKIDALKKNPYPYRIIEFIKLYPNATRYIGILKKFAQYLENNGVSNRDIHGCHYFEIEKYVNFKPYNQEVMRLIEDLNDEALRKSLGLEKLPEKTKPYTKTDFLRDYDAEMYDRFGDV